MSDGNNRPLPTVEVKGRGGFLIINESDLPAYRERGYIFADAGKEAAFVEDARLQGASKLHDKLFNLTAKDLNAELKIAPGDKSKLDKNPNRDDIIKFIVNGYFPAPAPPAAATVIPPAGAKTNDPPAADDKTPGGEDKPPTT